MKRFVPFVVGFAFLGGAALPVSSALAQQDAESSVSGLLPTPEAITQGGRNADSPIGLLPASPRVGDASGADRPIGLLPVSPRIDPATGAETPIPLLPATSRGAQAEVYQQQVRPTPVESVEREVRQAARAVEGEAAVRDVRQAPRTAATTEAIRDVRQAPLPDAAVRAATGETSVEVRETPRPVAVAEDKPAPAKAGVSCDADNAGLKLPPGFCALVVADKVDHGRHLAVADNGDVFVATRSSRDREGGIVVLRDNDGDGRADMRARFGTRGGTGIALHEGFLYFATDDAVMRWPWPDGQLRPSEPSTSIVADLLAKNSHAAKTIVFGPGGALYVNIGAPSNACQAPDRAPNVAGQEPCPLLNDSGGVWRFDAHRGGQTQRSGQRFASGLRNAMALAVHPRTGVLYAATHGRDSLHRLWPSIYSDEDNATRPAEEFYRLDEGDDLGWPYCYFDLKEGRHILNPEYGGDGRTVGRCSRIKKPAVAFPAHWSPLAATFPRGEQFPEKYRSGVFVSFRGSWDRAPLPQAGYNVAFAPFAGDQPTGEYEVFASGFAGETPTTAGPHRPTGVAFGPDGSLYVADDTGGRVYRILYRGK